LAFLAGDLFSDSLKHWVTLFVLTFAGVVLGVPFARSLQRFFPLDASGASRPWLALLSGVATALLAAGIIALWLPDRRYSGLMALFQFLVDFSTDWLIAILSSLAFAFGLLSVRARGGHRLWAAGSQPSFMLFLRRFSNAVDTAAIGPLLAGTSGGTRLAFLVNPGAAARSLDPVVLEWAGLNLRHPLRSIPVYLRARNDAWEAEVERLACAAAVVFLDVEDFSASTTIELLLLARLGLGPRTVLLHRRVESLAAPRALLPDADTLRYQLSRARSIPRVLSVSALGAASACAILMVADAKKFLVVVAGLAAGAAFALVFGARPSITRESRTRLMGMVRSRVRPPAQ
jgi:hypothetical protein